MAVQEHEVVISGVSGKFPGCGSLDEFKEKLFSKSNLFILDPDRWDPSQQEKPYFTGKLPDSDRFDYTFFGVPTKLVRNSDPQIAQVLERSYEAMVDAGVNPATLKGHNVCVISATSLSDAEILRGTDGAFLEGLGMVGHSRTMIANRISYCFNFKGPSYNIDNSWVTAVQGLEMAAKLVAQGLCESAIVASCNLIFYNSVETEYKHMDFLSPDDTCAPFDANAHGFSRSEGSVTFFLQRAQDAKRHYCSIIDAKVHYQGDRNSAYFDTVPQLESFYTDFYEKCKTRPSDVSYVEASGYCDKNFDAQELNALAQAFCNENTPLLVGSVEGNMGNSEAPSGFVSLAKAIITMEGGVIPPTVNYHTPNPDVPALSTGQLKPVTEPTELPGDLVAINCMSFSGNTAHVLVRRNTKTKRTLQLGELPADEMPRLVVLQTRHEEGAKASINAISSAPVDEEFVSLVNDVFTVNVPNYLWRAYTIVPPPEHVSAAENTKLVINEKKPVWYIFSGMGSQWTGMGRDLLSIPVFAAAIDNCDRVLRPRGLDIKHIISSEDATVFDNILNSFVGIAAIQIGLVDILRTLGVSPDGMIGHSVGELGCAYADGCFTAEQMILAAYARGKASLESDVIQGLMAAVGLGYKDVKDRLPSTLDVACHNSATSSTLSGPTEDVYKYVDQLKKDGVFAKAVSAGDIAYHSRYIKPVAPKLLQYLRQAVPDAKPRSSKWISSSVPESQWDTQDARMCSAEYHTNNLLNPVLFEEACEHLPKNAILIEIAPRGLLQAILRRVIGPDALSLSMTSNVAGSNVYHLLNTIGQLFLYNVDVDINALYPPVQYPVSRGTRSLVDLATWEHKDVLFQEIRQLIRTLIRGASEGIVEINQRVADYQLWQDHRYQNQVIMPVTQLLMYPWKMIFDMKRLDIEEQSVVIADVTIGAHVPVEGSGSLLVTCGPATLNFEVSLTPGKAPHHTPILKGKLYESEKEDVEFLLPQWPEESELEEVGGEEFYSMLAHYGCQLGPRFQVVKQLIIGKTDCFAKVQWTGNLLTFLDALFKVIIFIETDGKEMLMQMTSFNKLTINPAFFKKLEDGAVVEVHYQYWTHRLVCKGVELVGATLVPGSPNKALALRWREVKFQSYSGTGLTLEEFLSASVQIAADSALGTWSSKIAKLNTILVKDDNGTAALVLGDELKDVMKNQSTVSPSVHEMDYTRAKERLAQPGLHTYLLAGKYNTVVPLVDSCPGKGDIYCLACLNQNEVPYKSSLTKPIMAVALKGGKLVLLKNTRGVQTGSKKTKMFEVQGVDWLERLRKLMQEDDSEERLIVHSTTLMPRQLLPILAGEPYAHRLSTLFVMDKNAPRFSPTSTLYNQLNLGLPVNILYNGAWGTLISAFHDISPQEKKIERFLRSLDVSLKVHCVGLNTTTFTLNQDGDGPCDECDFHFVDYSGSVDGQRVMGVAQFDSVSNNVSADPILRWTVPADWTMEDAATVPVTYALGYYCMNIKGKVEAGERLLVHAGMSPIGQAVIGIALDIGANVFASVTSEEELLDLMKMYPALKPSHVMVLGSQDVAVTVHKLTEGKGAEVIVNCLRGRDLQSTTKVMGFDCRLLHLGRIKAEDRESVGMLVFLKRTAFCGVTLDSVINSNDDIKTTLQAALQRGFERGVVKPLKRSSFSLTEETKALQNLKTRNSVEKTVLLVDRQDKPMKNLKNNFSCNPDYAVIISGTSTSLWLDVAEWQIAHGTRKLIVLADEENLVGSHVRRFNRIINQNKTTLVVSSALHLDSHEEAIELLKDVLWMGPFSYVFCLRMEDKRMKNLDSASRHFLPQLQQFVTLLGEGVAVCESRAASGLPGCSVQSSSPLDNPANILPYLSTILADSTSRSRFFVTDPVGSTSQTDVMDAQAFLPSTVEELYSVCSSVTDRPRFTEEVTRSPGHQHTRHNLLPVFVVSALGAEHIRPLLRQLIHPAFCCTLPQRVQSVQQFAEDLLQEMMVIQPKGPYTLVGDSWGGGVALSLACLLEAGGHTVELVLLEGIPTMAQERLRALCQQYGADLGSSLLKATHSGSAEALKTLPTLDSWEEKVQLAIQTVEPSKRLTVTRVLDYLYSQLTAVLQFQPPSQLFGGTVTLIQCSKPTESELNKLLQFCQQPPDIVVVGDDHYDGLIHNAKTASAINKNASFVWRP